jgi:hypothetical protein
MSDADDIKRAEARWASQSLADELARWASQSLADELAAMQVRHVERENERDRIVVKLRVAQPAPDAEEIPPLQAA